MAKFKKGESGNPSGRPKQDSARIREELNKHSDEIVKVLLEKVKEGDTAALKMALDRISPALKPTGHTVKLEASNNSLEALSESMIQALIDGSFSTDTLKDLSASMTALARVEEVTELRQRLETIEKLLQDKEVTA